MGDRPMEGPRPTLGGKLYPQGGGFFKRYRYQKEALPVSIRVKFKGKLAIPKERQEDAVGWSPEVPPPPPDMEPKPCEAGTSKSKIVQEQGLQYVSGELRPFSPRAHRSTTNRVKNRTVKNEGRRAGEGNRHWPGLAGQKARDPENHILRKLHMSHLNADTNRNAMYSYFKKFGPVKQC